MTDPTLYGQRERLDDASIRNARILAQACRDQDEKILPMAAGVADALVRRAGMSVEVYGMSSGALAELIDHLADRAEHEMAKE
jgi:hypothetical protein